MNVTFRMLSFFRKDYFSRRRRIDPSSRLDNSNDMVSNETNAQVSLELISLLSSIEKFPSSSDQAVTPVPSMETWTPVSASPEAASTIWHCTVLLIGLGPMWVADATTHVWKTRAISNNPNFMMQKSREQITEMLRWSYDWIKAFWSAP